MKKLFRHFRPGSGIGKRTESRSRKWVYLVILMVFLINVESKAKKEPQINIITSNNPPTVSNIKFVEQVYEVGKTLTVTYDYFDQNSDPENGTTYQWYKDEEPIAGATEISYTPTPEDDYARLKIEITPKDGTDFGNPTFGPLTNSIKYYPKVLSVIPPAPGTYAGGIHEIKVVFNKIVYPYKSYINVKIGYTTKQFTTSDSGNDTIVYYSSFKGLHDEDGIEIEPEILFFGTDGKIRDINRVNATDLTLYNLPNTKDVLFDGIGPRVTDIILPADSTYKMGDALDYKVIFNEPAVQKMGVTYLRIVIGTQTEYATYYSGEGTNEFIYRYEIKEFEKDEDGVVLDQTRLMGFTNSSALRDTFNNVSDYKISHLTLGDFSGIKVDASLPKITTTTLPEDGFYGNGVTMDFSITFDEPVTVEGVPYLELVFGEHQKQAIYQSGSGTNTILFQYTVDEVSAPKGLTVNIGAESKAMISGKNGPAHIPPTTLGSSDNITIDGVAPAVTSVVLPSAKTYMSNYDFFIHLKLNESVSLSPEQISTEGIIINFNGELKKASFYNGNNSSTLTYLYKIEDGLSDYDGFTLDFSEITMLDAANNAFDPSQVVYGPTDEIIIDSKAPSMLAIEFPEAGTYGTGQEININVKFDEPMQQLTGWYNYLWLEIGENAPRAYYSSQTDSTVTFSYTIEEGDQDNDGIIIKEISSHSNEFRDLVGYSADLTITDGTSAVLVDAVEPEIVEVLTPEGKPYKIGDQLKFYVNWNEALAINGTPVLELAMGSETVDATYTDLLETTNMEFTLDIAENLSNESKISISKISLNGGEINDPAGNIADITLKNVHTTSNIYIDAIKPSVESVEVPVAWKYSMGEVLKFKVNFNERVDVSGNMPELQLNLGSDQVLAALKSGNGTSQLIFEYEIQENQSYNGIEVDQLVLNTGHLIDIVGNEANYTLNNIGDASGIIIDAVLPVVESVKFPDAGTYQIGKFLTFEVAMSEPMIASGTPKLPFKIGTYPASATYFSDLSTQTKFVFRYQIEEGVNNAEQIELDNKLSFYPEELTDFAGNSPQPGLNLENTIVEGISVDGIKPTVLKAYATNETGIYGENELLTFEVQMSEKVQKHSNPVLKLSIGNNTVNADFSSLTDDIIQFTYHVSYGDEDADGVVIEGLDFTNGSFSDLSYNTADETMTPVTTTIKMDTRAPEVTKVEAPQPGAYGTGDEIYFDVTWSEDVLVSGEPILEFNIGDQVLHAKYMSGTAANLMKFKYIIPEGLSGNQTIAFEGLSLNQGSIKDGIGNDAVLQLNNVADVNEITLDGLNPQVTSVDVPEAGTYTTGKDLSFSVNWSEVTTLVDDQSPLLKVKIGDQLVNAVYTGGTGTNSWDFALTIQEGWSTSQGIAVESFNLNGSIIQDEAKNIATPELNLVGNTSDVLVDAVMPVVSEVMVPADRIYHVDEAIEFKVKWSEAVSFEGTAKLNLGIGDEVVAADYISGNGTDEFTFSYKIQPNQHCSDEGISIIDLTGDQLVISDIPGNTAVTTLNNIGSTAGVKVEAVLPAIVGFKVPETGTYTTGDQLNFTVQWNEAVNLTGDASLKLKIGDQVVNAAYKEGNGTQELVFSYKITGGLEDIDGLAVESLELNEGSIADLNENYALLELNNLPATDGIQVDAVSPEIVSIDLPAGNTYTAGDELEFKVNWSEAVFIDGNPTLKFMIGDQEVSATYQEGSGSDALVFTYTVKEDDLADQGITLANLDLNGASLGDAKQNQADLTLNNIGDAGLILVDAVDPEIIGVTLPASDTYRVGDQVKVTVHWSEVVTVDGTPQLSLLIDGEEVQATYLEGSGTTDLVFTYEVTEDDQGKNDIALGDLSLNGGAIDDAGNNVADLTNEAAGTKIEIKLGKYEQTISLAEIADKKVGQLPVVLEATGGESGQPVNFTIETSPASGVASLSGNTIIIQNVGTVTITATQAGNELYEAATPVVRTFNIVGNELFLPTLFTPNNDGNNDQFVIRGGGGVHKIEFSIFDRDNNIVYYSNNWNEITSRGWDGKVDGREQPVGAYIWVLKGQLKNGHPVTINGKNTGIVKLLR